MDINKKSKHKRVIKIGNRGFSLVEILTVIVIIGILTSIGIIAYSKYKKQAVDQGYEAIIKSAQSAMDEYLMDHPNTTKILLSDLAEGDYISSLSDPANKGNDCRGLIKVNEDSATGKLDSYNYTVTLCCTNYTYTHYFPSGEVKQDRRCRVDPITEDDIIQLFMNIDESGTGTAYVGASGNDQITISRIKILNVYPNASYAQYFKNWMNTYGKNGTAVGNGANTGYSIMDVTPVSIENFNSSPQNYLKKDGDKWNYDVVVFGFADCNSSKDLSQSSAQLVANYLDNGGSAIFGHDTITKGCGNHKNFITLEDYVNIETVSDLAWNPSTQVKINKKSIFTSYPYDIEAQHPDGLLTIPTSHVYGQVAHGEVYLKFTGITDPAKSVYLSVVGQNAFIQTGHTNGTATPDEQKILANLIIYSMATKYIATE